MDQITSFGAYLLQQSASPSVGMQMGVLVIAATLGWFAQARMADYKAAHPTQVDGWRKLALHAAHRLVLPLTMLLLVVAGRAILIRLHWQVALLNIVIPLLVSMAAIRALVYLLQKSVDPKRGLKAWENVISTTIWILVALHLVGWLPEVLEALDEVAFTLGKTRLSLLALIKLTLAVAILLLVALGIARTIENKLSQSPQVDPGMRIGLAKFSKFVLFTLAILIALNSVGIDLTALAVFGGALGVGLGFGLQRIASNLVSGFILIFERSIRPGDIVSVGNSSGEIKELRARYVVIRSGDGVDILIPNENLITSEVINWTYGDRHIRVKVPLQISYKDNPELAMRLMLDAAHGHRRVISEPVPLCMIMGLGENGINLELGAWINDPEEGTGNVRSELYLAILNAFKAHDITLPFPQREIYIKHALAPLPLTGERALSPLPPAGEGLGERVE